MNECDTARVNPDPSGGEERFISISLKGTLAPQTLSVYKP
jgi:hypothetical protein